MWLEKHHMINGRPLMDTLSGTEQYQRYLFDKKVIESMISCQFSMLIVCIK